MKKTFISFVSMLMFSSLTFGDTVVVNKNNLDSYLEVTKPWTLQGYNKPMHIVNQTGALLYVDIRVDYGVSEVFLMCNDFVIGNIKPNEYSGCLIKNNGYAMWNKDGVRSSGTFILFRGGEGNLR